MSHITKLTTKKSCRVVIIHNDLESLIQDRMFMDIAQWLKMG